MYYEKNQLFEDIGTFCGVANILNCNWDYVCPGLLCQGELVTYGGGFLCGHCGTFVSDYADTVLDVSEVIYFPFSVTIIALHNKSFMKCQNSMSPFLWEVFTWLEAITQ